MLGLRHEFLLCWGVILSRMREYRSLHGGPFLFAFVRACVAWALNWEKALYRKFDSLRDLLRRFASPSLHSRECSFFFFFFSRATCERSVT